MNYGLIQSGRNIRREAMQGLSDVARNNEQREQTNQSLKEAKRQQETVSSASGAVMGAQIGTQVMPGWGTAIGAGLGLLAGWALS